ncbi:DsbA family protein [Gordonia sp. NPDC003950]
MTTLAQRAGVRDLERFARDTTGSRFDAQIESDLALAKSLFIPPVPAFWINGTPLLGGFELQPYVDVIDGVRAQR